MKKLASRLPIQQMIANAINAASEKLAEDASAKDSKVQKLLAYEKKEHGHIPTPAEEEAEHEKTASVTSELWVEKLAAAVEHIVDNFDDIEFPQKGILQKAAEEAGSPQGAGKGPGALEVSKAIGGQQSYEMGQAKNIDASSSKANTPLSGSHPGDGKTQLENDMHDAPGGGDVAPTATYPEKGPLVAGPSAKHASVQDLYMDSVLDKEAGLKGKLQHAGGVIKAHLARGSSSPVRKGIDTVKKYGPTAAVGGALGAASSGSAGAIYGAVGGKKGKKGEAAAAGARGGAMIGGLTGAAGMVASKKLLTKMVKKASAREILLAKLAGEDVLKADISAEKSANPLAGMGQLESFDAEKAAPHQAGDATGSGFGNGARRLIASNQAAIDATKEDAKGPVKSQLSEVLDEPALTSSTDSVLENNLRNTGKAGVKIAAARTILEKVAAEGCTCETIDSECSYCILMQKVAAAAQGKKGSTKIANAMMGYGGATGGMMPPAPMGSGGGMSTMADAGAGADGCTCGNVGECRVCKMKAALAAAKASGMMPGADPMGAVVGAPPAAPVEKDSGSGHMGGAC